MHYNNIIFIILTRFSCRLLVKPDYGPGLRMKFQTLFMNAIILICHSFLICLSNFWPLGVRVLSVFLDVKITVMCRPGSSRELALRPRRPKKLKMVQISLLLCYCNSMDTFYFVDFWIIQDFEDSADLLDLQRCNWPNF